MGLLDGVMNVFKLKDDDDYDDEYDYDEYDDDYDQDEFGYDEYDDEPIEYDE